MKSSLAPGLAHIKEFEGHRSDDSNDPGGLTVWGIAWNRIGKTLGLTKDEFRNLSWEKASEIYDEKYFKPSGCDNWPAGLDLMVFDTAVNQGVKRAVQFLQRAVRVKADGIIGPKTRGAVKSATRTDERLHRTVIMFLVWRTMHYTALSQFVRYGRGWLRRAFTAHWRAMELMCILFMLGGCGSIEGKFAKVKEAQAIAEQRVDALVTGLLEFTCDLDVKRLNMMAQKDPAFVVYFFDKCGEQFAAFVTATVRYRNTNPIEAPK